MLLALRHDPPEDSPLVGLALQHLRAFLEAEADGTFARNVRVEHLMELLGAKYQKVLGLRR